MAETIGGGGEWAALREALLAKAKEWRRRERHAGSPGEACVYPFLADELEALAAAAPALPCALPACVMPVTCKESGYCLAKTAALPPQDGQGAELLGPPRGGSSSDLAATKNLKVGRAPKVGWMDSIDFEDELGNVPNSEIHMNEAQCRQQHACIVPPDNPGHYCYPKRVYVFDADAYDATKPNPTPTTGPNEAVAGNASAPVGESVDRKLLLERMDGALRNAVGMLEAYQKLVPDARAQLEIKLAKEIIDSAELKAALAAPPVASAPVGEKRQPSGVGEPRIVLDACFGDPWVWSEGADHSDALASNDWILIKAPALRALAPREVGEGLREALEKLANKWLEDKPYRDDQYWEGVRECGRQIIKLLDPAALTPAPKPELTSRDCICPTTCDGPEYNLKILPNCPWHSRAPKPAPPAEPQIYAMCICSGYHDDGWVNPNCPVHGTLRRAAERKPPR